MTKTTATIIAAISPPKKCDPILLGTELSKVRKRRDEEVIDVLICD
jgi:hypothetical protein